MAKKTKIIVIKNTNNLGQKGDILNVARGYAFNFLIPNNLVELATPGKLKQLYMFKQNKSIQLEQEIIKAEKIKQNLEQISKISIRKKVGENQQIFGSVNEKEIIQEIYNYTGCKLEKKQIHIPNIENIGIYILKIIILNNISTNLKLQILPEGTEINI